MQRLWTKNKENMSLRGIGLHLRNGSPECPGLQLQIGLWLITMQTALIPQVPTQGSTHFWFMHASLWGHSALTVHSGLQAGGLPRYVGRQEHTAWLFTSRHWLFGPQGEGMQAGTSWTTAEIIKKSHKKLSHIFRSKIVILIWQMSMLKREAIEKD